MRRFTALCGSAAREALSEPLSAVMFLLSAAATHVLPILHCHQFGDPARLPMECGFSSILVFGLVFSTAAAVRSIGREIEGGTASAALARPVSREMFFIAKMCGVLAALGLFCATAWVSSALAVVSARAGAALLAQGAESRTWGPGLALGIGLALAAFVAAALANRAWRTRFCQTACLGVALSQPLALALAEMLPGAVPVEWRTLPAAAVLASGCAVFTTLAGALAVVLRPATTVTAVAAAAACAFLCPVRWLLPDMNRFWMTDRFVGGGVVPASETAAVALAGAALVSLWMAVGAGLMSRRELP